MSKIKRIVRRVVENSLGKDGIIECQDKISTADVISFDLYDTLVYRCCRFPEDIFSVVENYYNRVYEKNISFAKLRREAEVKARKLSGGEVNITDIYRCFDKISSKELEIFKELEISAELDFVTSNTEMVSVLNKCISLDKKVIIISDMYLSNETIHKVIQKCGIEGVSEIFVSNEYGASKRTGDLFDLVLNKMRISPNQLLHIGDHFVSDYLSPKKKGICSCLYKRKNDKAKNIRNLWKYDKNNLNHNILVSCSINSIQNENLNYLVGNRVLGSMLLGYCNWLYDYLKKSDIANVVFLSREGRIIKTAYDMLFSHDSCIKTFYVNVSRLSVCRACASKAGSFDELIEVFSRLMKGVETVFDLIKLLSGDETGTINNLKPEDRLDSLTEEDKERLFLFIKEEYGDFFRIQNELLIRYLYEKGFDQDVIAISDIGWSGSMQLHLSNIFSRVRIVGNYLAVSSINVDEHYSELQRRGFFCNYDEWKDKGQIIRFTQSAIETLFMTDEGSTLKYEEKNDEVSPVKSTNDWSDISKNALLEVEQGAIDFIDMCNSIEIYRWLGVIDPSDCMNAYICFAGYPNKATKDFYGQFQFVDGINKVSFLPKYRLIHYLINKRDLLNELEANNSKIIWLYSLCGLRLPYYRLLRFLAKTKGLESSYSKRYLSGRND